MDISGDTMSSTAIRYPSMGELWKHKFTDKLVSVVAADAVQVELWDGQGYETLAYDEFINKYAYHSDPED